MKNKHFNKILSLLVMLALLAAMALTFMSCAETADETHDSTNVTEPTEIAFKVEITKADGTVVIKEITTTEATVGDALVKEGLISGEEGSYGWFITTADGEYHKYEEDGKYWAFYINGEYASSGVSGTAPKAGTTYGFKVE